MKKFITLAAVVALGTQAEAGVFRRAKAVTCTTTTCQTQQPQQAKPAAKASGDTSTAAGVALLIVQTGRFRHFGGNPFAAEGIGMGSTPQAALQNCCFYGRRHIADVGYAQMPSGQWIAVARYR